MIGERTFITRTRFAGLRRLGVGGRHAQDSWDQIDAYLRGALGDAAARLFAEPVPIEDGGCDWYAAGATSAIAAGMLDEEPRERLLEEFLALHARITEEAKRLLAQSDPAQRRMGAMLETALSFAEAGGEPPLWSLDGHPVLVNWGTRIDGPEAATDPLQDYVKRARTPPAPVARPVPPAPEEPSKAAPLGAADAADAEAPRPTLIARVAVPFDVQPWLAPLAWLVLALLVAYLFLLLLAPCGVSGLTGTKLCPADRVLRLRSDLEALEAQLLEASDCTGEADRRRADAGGRTGAVTVTLTWNDVADLDLSIDCEGDALTFRHKSACGGVLDVDANRGPSGATDRPVENIYFASAPASGLKVKVRKHVEHERRWYRPGAVSFEVQVRRDGDVKVFHGSVTDGETVVVTQI